jgi:hypothetical protein
MTAAHKLEDPLIIHENREERQHIRIEMSIVLVQGQRVFRGKDVSLGGFSVCDAEDGTLLLDGAAELRLVFDTYQLVLPLHARRAWRNEARRITGFAITDMKPKQRELLRRVVRAHLSGQRLEVEQAMAAEDGQTPRRRDEATDGKSRHNAIGRAVGFTTYAVGVAVLAILVGLSAYERFLTIESEFAAVTAPEVVLRAPTAGETIQHSIQPGDRVLIDQIMVEIRDKHLDSEIALAEATLNYNRRLADNLARLLGGEAPASRVASAGPAPSLPLSPVPARLRSIPLPPPVPATRTSVTPASAVALDDADLRDVQARLEAFRTSEDFEHARIAALRLKAMSGQVVAPCDCMVGWALPGGTWVQQGDPLVKLVATEPKSLMVEAVVHVNTIGRISPNQRAMVTFPNTSRPVEARVHAINLDRERQPRSGFPEWVSHDETVATVLLVPNAPLSADQIGVPVQVKFIESDGLVQAARDVPSRIKKIFENGRPPVAPSLASLSEMSDLAETTEEIPGENRPE